MSSHSFSERLRTHFDALCSDLLAQLGDGEEATVNLEAEETLFVRFNRNRVRQNTDVEQIGISLRLQSQGRTVDQARTLSGRLDSDRAALHALLARCRAELAMLPDDPNQVAMHDNGSSDEAFIGKVLAAEEVVAAVVGPAEGCDLAGLYAGGVVIRANRNSKGQNHWFSTENFFLDYSIYNGPQAVKGNYAGSHWDDAQWAVNLERSKALLPLLARPTQALKPGA